MSSKHNKSISTIIHILILFSILLTNTFGGSRISDASAMASLSGWLYNTIEWPADTNYAPSLAVDSSGRPHVASVSGAGLDLIYSVYDGSQWKKQIVTSGGAQYINLALDSSDIPHIMYMGPVGNGRALFHAYRVSADWVTEQLTTSFSAGHYTAMALDEAGRPHAAYVNQDTGTLDYAFFDGASWQFRTAVAASKELYSNISLDLDSNELPRIAYCAGPTAGTCSSLRYIAFDGSSWTSQTLLTDEGGYSPSLAIDSMDRPHLSYFKVSKDGLILNLVYQYHDGTHWVGKQVASGARGLVNVLRLDSEDRPYIVYYDQSNRDLLFAIYDGSAWQSITVDSDDDTGHFPSFALDAAGQPHIAYIDVSETALQYAGKPPLPDLQVSDVFTAADNQLKAAVLNTGLASAQGMMQVEVSIDGVPAAPVYTSVALEPGGSTTVSQSYACSGESDTINACALIDGVTEMDPDNNCRQVTISCDSLPPVITAGPSVANITATSAQIFWTTSKPATSTVRYGWQAGIYAYENDMAMVTVHTINLTGLRSGVQYSYIVQSRDTLGNPVASKPAYFRTTPSAGNPPMPDRFEAEQRDPTSDVFGLKLRFSDTSSIQKVTFVVDGKPVGADYSALDGLFEVDLNPAELWPDRNQFYRSNDPHVVEAQVMSLSGSLTNYTYEFTPGANLRMLQGYFITPQEDKVFYIPGTVAPLIELGINVYASQMEWNCQWAAGSDQDCSELEEDVAKVEFYVGTVLKDTATTTTRTHTYSFDWNIQGLATGPYTLKAKIYDTDGNTKTVERHVSIETGQPSLTVERAVVRHGNHFDVTLAIKNTSPAGVPVMINKVYDHMVGFQPVFDDSGGFVRTGLTWRDGIYNRADISANDTIQPNQTLVIDYEMVPILYQDPTAVTPRIGATNVIGGSSTSIEYTVAGSIHTAEFNLETLEVQDIADPSGYSSIPASVSRVMAGSDYLIITSPQKMHDLYWDMWSISNLMGDVARLATLKNGVLVYWPSSGSLSSLNRLLEDGSAWANRLHPNFQTRGKGYVLLVGESDIIPSDTTGPFSVNFDEEEEKDVRYSDNTLAHTDGNGAPDLLLGRIVGGTPTFLDKAVNTSIRVHLGELSNDMSHVYLGSGTGNGETGMQDDADTMEQYFTSLGKSATKQHWETSSWLYQWPFPFAQRDGFSGGDLDGDGIDEVILASCEDNMVYVFNGETGFYLSSFPLDFEGGDGLTAGDVDNDGRDEIIHADRADQVHIFEVQSNAWVMIKAFTLDFDSGDDIATGNVLLDQAGDEIVVADNGQNTISVYDQNGTLLIAAVDLDSYGYSFEMYDRLAVGNVGVNLIGVDEVVVSDRTNQKLIIFGMDGTLIHEMPMAFEWGEQLKVADVTPDLGDEIIVSDMLNAVHIYRGRSNDPALNYTLLRSIYKDVEYNDGLAIRELAGVGNDEIIFGDRSHDRIVGLDAYYPEATRQAFRGAMPGQDLIWISAHGSPFSTSPAVDNLTFGLNFSGSAPIITAFSCLTGNYEDGGDQSMVVNFFNSGAGGYYGSTETTPMSPDSNHSRNLYKEFLDPGETIVKAALDFKNQRWDVSTYYDWWYYMTNEYNYYGDPKLQLTSAAAVQPSSIEPALALETSSVRLAAATTSIIEDLPEVSITSQDGFDYVEIPGGDQYLEDGQPIVPAYMLTYDYPAGVSVQDVRLVERSNRSEFNDLLLPLTSVELRSAPAQRIQAEESAIPTWTPALEQTFSWSVNSDPGRGSTLTLAIYPFHYNNTARYAEYYRHFEFEVSTITTGTSIQTAELSTDTINLGQPIDLHVTVSHTGDPADRIVSAAIYPFGAEPVSGFPLAYLPALSGEGSLDLSATSAGLPAGSYYVRVEVLDGEGQIHDWREVYFDLGVSRGQVSGLSPAQVMFRPGDLLTFTAQAQNTGDLALDAQLVLLVSAEAGDYQNREVRDLGSIPVGGGVPFTFTWDSTGVDQGSYRLAAYLVYDSQSSAVAQAEMFDGLKIFLPMVLK